MMLYRYLKKLWRKFRRKDSIEKVEWVESRQEIPEKIGDALYIVGCSNSKWVVVNCPCRCGEKIDINLMNCHSPQWRLKYQSGKITLFPSIWITEDKCGSHFWIKENNIIWVED